MEDFMDEGESSITEEDMVDTAAIARWAFMSTLEFLDGRFDFWDKKHGFPLGQLSSVSPNTGAKTSQLSALVTNQRLIADVKHEKGASMPVVPPPRESFVLFKNPESADFSNQIFFHALDCGMDSEGIKSLLRDLEARVDGKLHYDSLGVYSKDVEYPLNRLRIDLTKGESTLGFSVHEQHGDIKMHRGMQAGSILYLPVFSTEKTGLEKSKTNNYKGINTKALFDYIQREELKAIPHFVPMMTLQVCLFVLGFLRRVKEASFETEESETLIRQVLQLITGGREIYAETLGEVDRVSIIHTASKSLIFIPVLIGRKLHLPDMSDATTVEKIWHAETSMEKKSGEFSSLVKNLRGMLGGKQTPFDDQVNTAKTLQDKSGITASVISMDSWFADLVEASDVPAEISSLLVNGFGYDGYFVRRSGIGSIFMVDYGSLESTRMFGAHLRHLDFGFGNKGFRHGISEKRGGMQRFANIIGVRNLVHDSGHQDERLYLMANSVVKGTLSGILDFSGNTKTPSKGKGLCLCSIQLDEEFLEEHMNSENLNVAHKDIFGQGSIPIDFIQGNFFGEPPHVQIHSTRSNNERETRYFRDLSTREKAREVAHALPFVLLRKNPFGLHAEEYPFTVDRYPEMSAIGEEPSPRKQSLAKNSLVLSKVTKVKRRARNGLDLVSIETKLNNRVEPAGIAFYRLLIAEFLNGTQYKRVPMEEDVFEAPPLTSLDFRDVPVKESTKSVTVDKGDDSVEEDFEDDSIPDVVLPTPLSFLELMSFLFPKELLPIGVLSPDVAREETKGMTPKRIKAFKRKRKRKRLKELVRWLITKSKVISLYPFPGMYSGAFRSLREGAALPATALNQSDVYDFTRFGATHSAACAQAAILLLWIKSGIKIDTIGNDFKSNGLGNRGVGAWGPMSSFKAIFSDSGGYNPYMNMDKKEFDASNHVDRLVLSAYKSKASDEPGARRHILGKLEESFDAYVGEYQRLLGEHWELSQEVSTGEIEDVSKYMCSPLRAWHLDAVEQTSRLIGRMITYFSFRKHVVFGRHFSMFKHATGMLPSIGIQLRQATAKDVRLSNNWNYIQHSRASFSLGDRADGERAILDSMDIMDNWAHTKEQREMFLSIGAFDTETLPARENSLRGRLRITPDGVPSKPLKPSNHRISKRSQASEKLSWMNQSFSRVKFAKDFTLEGFDPSVHGNINTFDMIRKLDSAVEKKGLLRGQQGVLLDWLVERKHEKTFVKGSDRLLHDPPLRVRHSGDTEKGDGLFCDDPRGIPPGTFILPFDGMLVTHANAFSRMNPVDGMDTTYYNSKDLMHYGTNSHTNEPIYIAPGSVRKHYSIDSREDTVKRVYRDKHRNPVHAHLSRFINGAVSKSTANCMIVKWIVRGEQQIWIVNASTRTIQHGEELLISYDSDDSISFFKDIGLYSRSGGFVYPPDNLLDYTGTSQMRINSNNPSTTIHDPLYRIIEAPSIPLAAENSLGFTKENPNPVGTKIKGVEKKVVRLDNEIDMVRLLLYSALYDGSIVNGKVSVPRLDYFKQKRADKNIRLDARIASEKITAMEVQQVSPYMRRKKHEQLVFRQKAVITMRDEESFDYYGVPSPREPEENIYINPIFKRLAEKYGNSTILGLDAVPESRSFSNIQMAPYFESAQVTPGDTSIDVAMKRKDMQVDTVEDERVLSGITHDLFLPRMLAQFDLIQNALLHKASKADIRKYINNAKDMSNLRRRTQEESSPNVKIEKDGDGESGYRNIAVLEYSELAKEEISRAWKLDVGFSMYSQADIIPQNYELVFSNMDDTGVSTAKESSKVQEKSQTYFNVGEKKTEVMYSGVRTKGLGLYATKRIMPGEPILPFLGQVITPLEHERRTLDFLEEYRKVHEKYAQDVLRAIDEYIQLSERIESVQDIDQDTLMDIKNTIGAVHAKEAQLEYPGPEFYALRYIQVDGTTLVIDPRLVGNDARFSNSSRVFKNCSLQLVLMKIAGVWKKEATHEMVPWLVNTQNDPIEIGQEILWDYAHHKVYPPSNFQGINYDDVPWEVNPRTLVPRLSKSRSIDIRPSHASIDTTYTGYSITKDGDLRSHINDFSANSKQVVNKKSLLFAQIQGREVGLKLVSTSTSFPLGKETVGEEWSQLTTVVSPLPYMSGVDYRDEVLPVSGNEILSGVLSATNVFVPVNTTPLSEDGDILHQRNYTKNQRQVKSVVSGRRGFSDAITGTWCDAAALFSAIPMRHFSFVAIRNRWLDARGTGMPSKTKRTHTVSNELIFVHESSPDAFYVRFTRLLALASFAIDDLQQRLYSSLVGVSKDAEHLSGVQRKIQKLMPSQEQRNLLYLFISCWRSTSALFTNYKMSIETQTTRLQSLLHVLGFTRFYITSYVRKMVDGKQKAMPSGYSFSMSQDISSATDYGFRPISTTGMKGVPLYKHMLDTALSPETIKSHSSRAIELSKLLRTGRTKQTEIPPETSTKQTEIPLEASTRKDQLKYPIRDADADQMGTLLEILSKYEQVFSDETLALLKEKIPVDQKGSHGFKRIRSVLRDNLFRIQARIYSRNEDFPHTKEEFRKGREIVEAYFDFMIYHSLPHLKVIFDRMNPRHTTTLVGREAIRRIQKDINSFPSFVEFKTKGVPFKRTTGKKLQYTGSFNFLPVQKEGVTQEARGAAIYYMLAFYAIRLYLRGTYENVLNDDESNKGPIVFRKGQLININRGLIRVYPWWHENANNTPTIEEDIEDFEARGAV